MKLNVMIKRQHENRHDSVITNRTTPQLHLNDLVFIIMFEKKKERKPHFKVLPIKLPTGQKMLSLLS